jgi:hypothetical protein
VFHEDASLLLFLKPDGGIEPERYGDERQDGTETVGFDTDAFVAGQGKKLRRPGKGRRLVWRRGGV